MNYGSWMSFLTLITHGVLYLQLQAFPCTHKNQSFALDVAVSGSLKFDLKLN
jgi:hypothetical protein